MFYKYVYFVRNAPQKRGLFRLHTNLLLPRKREQLHRVHLERARKFFYHLD